VNETGKVPPVGVDDRSISHCPVTMREKHIPFLNSVVRKRRRFEAFLLNLY
jgi:hypothetical protein